MDERFGSVAEKLAGVLVFECRKHGATDGEFEILLGELRRALENAFRAARVRYWHEMNAEKGGQE
jgi:hypothetical protein